MIAKIFGLGVVLLACLLSIHGKYQRNNARHQGIPGSYPFQNTNLTFDERVDDLVMRLTVDEIAHQTLAQYGNPSTTAVPRLGIKPYVWITECVHGQVGANTTAFPHSIGIGASFSKELLYNMSMAISLEVRAHWNSMRKQNIFQTMFGVSCFSPVINIARHPLWGRNQETYGEDPFLSGSLVQNFVRGLQGDHPRYVRVNAGCKHFDVHAGPENIPVSRLSFDAKVSMRDWRMTFLPAFKMCVEAGTYNLMCSYNRINGVPACANGKLLTDITRKEWGFTGYIISDSGAINNIRTQHNYTKSDAESAAKAIEAGCNLELGSSVFLKQVDAMKQGMITETQLRENVKPLFKMRMKLGEFDPDSMNPYASIDLSEIQSASHRDLAVRAAQMTFTLLKNEQNALPIINKPKKLAIVGPFGNESAELFGDYGSNIIAKYTTTVWQGLKSLGEQVTYAGGCDDTRCEHYKKDDIMNAVKGSDVVVVALGTGQAVESEGKDRPNLNLPGYQLDLLKDTVYYGIGAKIVVLLFNAGPLDVTWAQLHPEVHAIMACFFPSQSAGMAVYNTLTANSADAVPAGRLPMTWPAYLTQVPDITNYTMEGGSTYRYYKGNPLYPFGYGLSYTTFQYTGLSVMPDQLTKGENLTVKVAVKNTGMYDADEVTQVYISWPPSSTVVTPKLQLAGFSRNRIMKGKEITIKFQITSEQIAVWMDDQQGWGIIPGKMVVYAGGQQPNQRMKSSSNVLMQTFTVTS